MNTAIIATEILGMLVILVILYGAIFEETQRNKKRNTFIQLCLVCLANIVLDALTYLPYDQSSKWMLFVITLVDFAMPYVIFTVFLRYLYASISTKKKTSFALFRIGIIYSIVMIVLSTILGIHGKMFTVYYGVYQTGPYYKIYLISYGLILAYILFLAIKYMKDNSKREGIAAIIFVTFPNLFILLDLLFAGAAFEIAIWSVDLLLMHVLLQAERESKLIERSQETYMMAHQDELTGLLNRLAYSEKCDSMEGSRSVGVLFCDVNGLKYANDHHGHVAGDKLLCDFADILKERFDAENIFRISGDEFVVFVYEVKEGQFHQRVDKLNNLLQGQRVPIASVGVAFGDEDHGAELIKQAETHMYEEKQRFHARYSQYSRL